MKKLLPIVLLLIGIGAGGGAGVFLSPIPESTTLEGETEEASTPAKETGSADEPPLGLEYVKMNNQFVVPVVKGDQISALVVLSLSIEASEGQSQAIYFKEPKLRDAFLQVMFDHANIGGFDGAFTSADTLEGLRRGLREVAQKLMGIEVVHDVLIIEIARQDY